MMYSPDAQEGRSYPSGVRLTNKKYFARDTHSSCVCDLDGLEWSDIR